MRKRGKGVCVRVKGGRGVCEEERERCVCVERSGRCVCV